MSGDDIPLLRLQGGDARTLAQLADRARTSPEAMGAALVETGLRALRETGAALDGTPPDQLAQRARMLQGRMRT